MPNVTLLLLFSLFTKFTFVNLNINLFLEKGNKN